MPEASTDGILGLLAQLGPPGIAPGVRLVAGIHPPLRAEEQAATLGMSPLRLLEFSAGRAAAREALGRLGWPATAIAVGAGRAPRWPDGIVGSITHTATVAAAVVAPQSRFQSLGLDAEGDDGLEAQLLPVVCRPEELARLPGPGPTSARAAKLVFCAKEAAYKCLSPLTGIFLEFQDLEITLQPATGSFRVRGHGPRAGPMPWARLDGRYGQDGGTVVALCWLAAGESGATGGEHRPAGDR